MTIRMAPHHDKIKACSSRLIEADAGGSVVLVHREDLRHLKIATLKLGVETLEEGCTEHLFSTERSPCSIKESSFSIEES